MHIFSLWLNHTEQWGGIIIREDKGSAGTRAADTGEDSSTTIASMRVARHTIRWERPREKDQEYCLGCGRESWGDRRRRRCRWAMRLLRVIVELLTTRARICRTSTGGLRGWSRIICWGRFPCSSPTRPDPWSGWICKNCKTNNVVYFVWLRVLYAFSGFL